MAYAEELGRELATREGLGYFQNKVKVDDGTKLEILLRKTKVENQQTDKKKKGGAS